MTYIPIYKYNTNARYAPQLHNKLLACLKIWGLKYHYFEFSPKPVCVQNTPQNRVCSARTRVWVTNPSFWEFNHRISTTIVPNGPLALDIGCWDQESY